MKSRIFTLGLALTSFLASHAQINSSSPFPATFRIIAPPAIAGTYAYGTQTGDATNPIWGPQLSGAVQGEIVWAYDNRDSLACGTITTNLSGKLAMVRRGECTFSQKVYNAQQAGAIGCIVCNHFSVATENDNTIVGMLGGDFADQVTIPAIFISRATCRLIDQQLAAGATVQGAFSVVTLYNAAAAYSFQTPQSQIIPIDALQVRVINPDAEATRLAEVVATIIDPDGNETELLQTKSIAPLSDSLVIFSDFYLPEAEGEYEVVFSSNLSPEEISARFVISDFTFATDDGEILGGVGPSNELFAQSGLIYQTGSLVLTGPDGAIATHASFGVENVAEIFTGEPSADNFTLLLYDADANDNGQLDFSANPSFDDLTPVAFGIYSLNGRETPNEPIVVPLESLSGDVVSLKPNGAYYISLRYDGVAAGLGIAPLLSATAQVRYPFNLTTPLYLDRMYSGFAGVTLVTRLHLDGFAPPTAVKTLLPAHKVRLSPNPSATEVQLQFELEQTVEYARIGVLDFSGRLLHSELLRDVREQTFTYDVRALPAGIYFFSILTPAGYRAEKFVVVKN
jgi:hypothetical protein